MKFFLVNGFIKLEKWRTNTIKKTFEIQANTERNDLDCRIERDEKIKEKLGMKDKQVVTHV